jgi:P4 family phage/plasmid primase-like protien
VAQNENIFLEQELINIINNSFKKSLKEGVRHNIRLKIGSLVGGCISGGWAREDVLLRALLAASDSVAEGGVTSISELKTLRDGITAGKEKPITEDDFKKRNGLSGDLFAEGVALDETTVLYTSDVRDGTSLTCPLTEFGNALRLKDIYGTDVKFIEGAGCFLHWDKNWRWDSEGSMTRSLAADLYKIIYREGERFPQQGPVFAAWSRSSQTEKTIKATVSLYKDIPENRVPLQLIDGNQFMVGLDNARQVINLKTGEVRPAERSDYITKSLNIREVGEVVKAERWLQFLFEVFGNDPELIDWLQRLCGYILTGSTKEQFFLFCYGLGANGKSVLLDILRFILGDYARAIASETLTDSKRAAGSASPDLADLIGSRLALTTESEENIALSESLIKTLTGGDTLTARKLYSAPTQFTPQFKIIMSGNHKPLIKGNDHGIWRRVRLLPFTRIFSEQERDPNLSEKLRAEATHILAWMVEGCLAWQKKGLTDIPATIKSATADYREDQDLIGAWLADCCQLSSQHETLSSTLYSNYEQWCVTNGLMKSSNKVFGRRLIERGFTSRKSNGKQFWAGVGIIPYGFSD